MVNITLSIDDNLKRKMEQFPEINWSGLMRKLLEEKTRQFELREHLKKEFAREQTFTNWSVELGKKAKKGRLKRLMHDVARAKKAT